MQLLLLLCGILFAHLAAAQVALSELKIQNNQMAKAFLRRPYHWQFEVGGGVSPFTWQQTGGTAPDGLTIKDDGTVEGSPQQKGEFHLVMTVADSAHPPHQKTQEFILTVVAALQIEWSRPPKVNGRRIEGAVKTTNGTEQDFDLTVVIIAVNADGRATALGYQRFNLQKDQVEKEIPFGENLPAGTYEVNADAVGEVAATNSIFRARLVASGLTVVQGP